MLYPQSAAEYAYSMTGIMTEKTLSLTSIYRLETCLPHQLNPSCLSLDMNTREKKLSNYTAVLLVFQLTIIPMFRVMAYSNGEDTHRHHLKSYV